MRNENLEPDWLRVGTDIVGGDAAFNAAFTLDGDLEAATPEPASLVLLATTMAGLGAAGWRRRRDR